MKRDLVAATASSTVTSSAIIFNVTEILLKTVLPVKNTHYSELILILVAMKTVT